MTEQVNPIEQALVEGIVGTEQADVQQEGAEAASEESPSFEGEEAGQSSSEETPTETPAQETSSEGVQESPDAFSPNPAWNILQEKLSTPEAKYELPEYILKGQDAEGNPLTPEKEFDYLVDSIARNIEVEDEDPFIAMYKAEKVKEGFNYDDFVKSYRSQTDILNLPSKEFMTEYLKMDSEQNKRGWTDDDISEFLEGKNKIELDTMAEGAKENMQGMLKAQASTKQAEAIKQRQEKAARVIEDYNKNIDVSVGNLVNEMSKVSKIGGLPHGQADIDEFLPIFKEQVRLNPATGAPNIKELFNDDKVLYETLYLLHKMKQGAFTDINEKAKQEVLQKTGLQKRQEGGTGKTVKVPKSDDYVT
jgi:hypothetical protein